MFDTLKAIVFDLDDTLYLQRDYKISGLKAVAQKIEMNHSIPTEESLNYLLQILDEYGPSYPFFFDRFVERQPFSAIEVQSLIDEFIRHTPQISCFPNVREMLKQLKLKYLLGLLTDGRVSSQKKKINALGLQNDFHEILCSSAIGLEKPAEELFLHFEKKFDLQAENLAYVADNPKKDFIGAKKRGWHTVRVLTGEYSTLKVPEHQKASTTLKDVTMLPSLLDSHKERY